MAVGDHLAQLEKELDECDVLRTHAFSNVGDPSTKALIYESVLLRAARSHENFIEGVFLSYLLGEPTETGDVVGSFVTPTDRLHARRLISVSANARFIDWSEASTIRERSSVFFAPDSPLYTAASAKSSELAWIKKVRNQAAHDSVESRLGYQNVLGHLLLVAPEPVPTAGDFLQIIPTSGPANGREILAYFLSALRDFAKTAAGA
jgi:hypothetical protein